MRKFQVVLGALMLMASGSTAYGQAFQSKGYACNLDPNMLDRPGVVFYIDPATKGRLLYEDLSGQIKTAQSPIPGTLEASLGNFDARGAAELTNIHNSGVAVKADGTVTAKKALRVSLNDRQKLVSDYSAKLLAINNLQAAANKPEKDIYIIREVQQAKVLDIHLNKGLSAGFGGEVAMKQAFSTSGQLGGETSSEFTIKQTFTDPMTVCIFAEKLKLKKPGKGLPAGTKAITGPEFPRFVLTGETYKIQ